MIEKLLDFPEIGTVIITHNIPEVISLPESPRVIRRWNSAPKGFGHNHNDAFCLCVDDFFCVMNPDIDFVENPFSALVTELVASGSAMIAPKVVDSTGCVEDSARHFPTILGIVKKVLGISDGRHMELSQMNPFHPECVAGMFMLFKYDGYRKLNGFDTRYFLYYEDIDICARIWKAGASVLLLTPVVVIHDAQRKSHKSFKFLRWHISSMLLFFRLHMWRLPQVATAYRSKNNW
ncbi:galactosyltransferase-related protein [Rhizobium metallidurans]|uniref:galactosyltransferase-related protein n=1 Tax=Rhizobium metallidurans TaxID=1265931 RepID=UPI001AED5D72|nr:galactosyltransferase-related protein [Rhizobium metallidurans]